MMYTPSGGVDQTAFSHDIWEGRGLEERRAGFSRHSAWDGTEVSFIDKAYVSNQTLLHVNVCVKLRFCLTVQHPLLPLSLSLLRQYNVDYKLDTYLKIARLYLEDDDPVQAEAYINRASLLQNESTNEQLQIHYKVHSLHLRSILMLGLCSSDNLCGSLRLHTELKVKQVQLKSTPGSCSLTFVARILNLVHRDRNHLPSC